MVCDRWDSNILSEAAVVCDSRFCFIAPWPFALWAELLYTEWGYTFDIKWTGYWEKKRKKEEKELSFLVWFRTASCRTVILDSHLLLLKWSDCVNLSDKLQWGLRLFGCYRKQQCHTSFTGGGGQNCCWSWEASPRWCRNRQLCTAFSCAPFARRRKCIRLSLRWVLVIIVFIVLINSNWQWSCRGWS